MPVSKMFITISMKHVALSLMAGPRDYVLRHCPSVRITLGARHGNFMSDDTGVGSAPGLGVEACVTLWC
jgi:hypothetical protein